MNKLISQATFEPVTVTELAVNLRLTTDEASEYAGPESLLMAGLISAGRQAAEDYTGRIYCQQTRSVSFDHWGMLGVPYAQAAITSVEYYDEDEVLQTLDAANYKVIERQFHTEIHIRDEVTLPDLMDYPNCVVITFTAGYSSAALIPQKIKQAILLIASFWFENREAAVYTTSGSITELPLAFKALLDWKERRDSFA